MLPGDPGVVHHAIVFVRPPDGSEFQGIGWLGAYVPGQRSVGLPPGHARRVPAGSKLIFQIHYTPNGRKTTDRTRVGVWEANADDVTHEVYTNIAIDQEFEIPPGAEEYLVEMSVDSFPPNSRMLGITPHMHLRGKSFLMEAVRSGGKKKTLLSVPRYDFNWQHWYEFANPVELDDVKSLQMKVTFDNSASNPFNPDHLKFVDWGDQTSDEMAMAFFDVAIPRGGAKHKTKEWRPLSDQEVASRKRQIDEHVEAFLGMMDSDKDGVVEREETPVTFQRYGFNRLDRNRDGRIDRAETEKNAAERL